MRAKLRSKISLLFVVFAVMLALPAIALADTLSGDADADALATPKGNSSSHTQQPGTTATYNFDAYIRESGSAADNVFQSTGDNVKVSIARAGDWLASPAGTPANMTFTKYTDPTATSGSAGDNTQSGTIAVKVPCGTVAGTQTTMTVTLTGIAYDDGPDNVVGTADDVQLPSGRQLSGNGTLTLSYVITAQGSDAASCAPANSAPVINKNNASVTVNEGQTATNTGTWSDANAGDTVNLSASVGTVQKSGTNASGTWSWSYPTTDGPDESQTVTITANDGKGGVTSTTFSLTVNNVAPTTTLSTTNPVSVDEGSTQHIYNYTIFDPGADTVSSVSTSCGDYGTKVAGSGSNTNTSGSFKCTFDDGTKQSTVSAQATDSDGLAGNKAAQTVNIANVAPTITGISASAQDALTGKNVTFTGAATDPSSADTTAGFFWQWSKDGGAYTPSTLPSPFAAGGNPFTTSFSTCGAHSVSAKATDKDGGSSQPVSSSSVNLYDASFLPPIDGSPYINMVQKGRVIPVKISVSCNGNVTGLTPSIQLLSGDKTDGSETTLDEVETYSVSAADSTGVMRAVDGGYIYNLRVPDVANAYYTVRVNPFGGSDAGSNMYALLKTRK